MVSDYEIELLDRDICGDDVGTFRFTRPDGYEFRAGQWMRITIGADDTRESRTFSHASAPADDRLELTTRRSSSAFKRALWGLRPSERIGMTGPGGRLALPEDARKAVFLAGGVGITPVRSILRDARQRLLDFDEVVVFYGNRNPECMPYLEELESMGLMGVRVIPVYEEDAPAGASSGMISAALIREHLDPGDGRPVIVTGPPAMVAAMELVLDELEVPSEARTIERFGP